MSGDEEDVVVFCEALQAFLFAAIGEWWEFEDHSLGWC